MPIDTPDSIDVRRAAEDRRERPALLAREQIPGGHLDGRFGHVMAADGRQRVEDLARMIEATAEHERRDELGDDVPRRPRGLGAVVRVGVGDALAEPADAVVRRPSPGGTLDRSPVRSSSRRTGPAAGAADRSSMRSIRTAQCYRTRRPGRSRGRCILRSTLDFRYIAIEGAIGVGKSRLADRLGSRLDATVVLDDTDNPFLADAQAGRTGAAFQAQLFFTLARHRQQTAAAPVRSLQPADHLRLPLRARQDLRVPEPRRQRAVHLSASLRAAGARSAGAGPGDLPADTDRRAAPPPARDARAEPGGRAPRRHLRPRAERGVQPFLLPLLRDARSSSSKPRSSISPGATTRSPTSSARSRRCTGGRDTTCRGRDSRSRQSRVGSQSTVASRRSVDDREPSAVGRLPTADSPTAVLISSDGVVQEGPQANRAARSTEPGARGLVGQVSLLRAGHLQQGPGGEPQRLHEVRTSFPAVRDRAAPLAVRRRVGRARSRPRCRPIR